MNNIFILLGPTASGKSYLSYRLANDFDFEIINADLFSIYKYLNIGTAKPSKEKFKNYQHHLFDKLEPNESYNVSNYCLDTHKVINNILQREKMPLIVGGSMMYVFQLLNGLTSSYNLLNSDYDLIKYILGKYDNKDIINSINNLDSRLTSKIEINDSYRLEKLLERLISKEKPQEKKYNGLYNDNKFNINILFINIEDRKILKENIRIRTEKMINEGLVNEVQELKKRYHLTEKHQSMKAIGYKETLQYINKKICLDELITLITVSTQQLAKRQITWKNKFKINHLIAYPELDYVKLSKYVNQILK